MSPGTRLGALVGLIALLAVAYLALGTRGIAIQLELPVSGEEGFIIEVSASYVRDGKRETVILFDEVVSGDTVIQATLPLAAPWQFESIRTQVRHPFYRPTAHYATTNPHWKNASINLTPELWSRSHDYYLVPPSEETTMAALDHLRWLREEYAARVPPHIFVQEVRRSQLMLGSLAFARGEKEGGWEQSRRVAVDELNQLAELLDALTYEPCPEDYQRDPTVPIICGRSAGDTSWPE